MDSSRLRHAIKQMRLKLGMTQRELEEKSQVDQTKYSRYEHGKTELNIKELEQICRAMGVSLTEMEHASNQYVHLASQAVSRQEHDRIKTELIKAQQRIIELQDEILKLKK